ATRPDLLGVELTSDLAHLKDKLPPFPVAQAQRAVTDSFGEDAKQLFPPLGNAIAAASIAQVHRIETADGPRAVKLLRPGVEARIAKELRAMMRGAKLLERRSAEGRRLRLVAFVETLAESMTRELDLRFEAGAASEFAEIIADDGFVSAPAVDWTRTSDKVLTTDWVDGTPLTDPAALEGVDRKALGERIVRGFLATTLDHGFFHADLHEGNMIVTEPVHADGPHGATLVDFGIMGRIGPAERRFLAEILNGFLRRDYHRIAEVHFEAGYVPETEDVGAFAQALRAAGEPIFGQTAENVSMSRLLLQLFDITHQFGMQLRPELVLLQKTMVQVEGVARAIDPQHNIWEAARPVVERWVKREFGPEGAARLAAETARRLGDRAKRLPEMIDKFEAALDAAAASADATDSKREKQDALLFAAIVLLAAITGYIVGNWG
ncbi:MAG: AarF/UbiB family protein, partial [Pseudomonadota bacterium]